MGIVLAPLNEVVGLAIIDDSEQLGHKCLYSGAILQTGLGRSCDFWHVKLFKNLNL